MDNRAGDQGEEDVDVLIGRRLRALRLERGVCQDQLALLSGLPVREIERYENGALRFSVIILVRLAEALRTPVADLLREVP